MNEICQRLKAGADHATTLTRQSPHGLFLLELTEYGVRVRHTYKRPYDDRLLLNYEVTWNVLETAHINPLIEALNLCKRSMEEEVARLKVSGPRLA